MMASEKMTNSSERLKFHCLAAVLTTILLVACERVPGGDTPLKLRQLSAAGVLEVAVGEERLDIVVSNRTGVLERVRVRISAKDSDKIRSLFWDSLRHQPTAKLHPVRDLTFEQEWLGRARTQKVLIQGYPITLQDRRAYEYINQFVPERHRFMINSGFYRRSD
jgi:hypothetical protein